MRAAMLLVSLAVVVACDASIGVTPTPLPIGAAPITCDGIIRGAVVAQVTVPDGVACSLEGTTVNGDVIVGSGAALHAQSVNVDGSIAADGAAAVNVVSSNVGGSISIERGGSAQVNATVIGGELRWQAQTGALLGQANDIGGNLAANDNTGGLRLLANAIGGNLECQGNDPAPTGEANDAVGSKVGQCADL